MTPEEPKQNKIKPDLAIFTHACAHAHTHTLAVIYSDAIIKMNNA